jgi:hypothetical protein
MAPSWPRLLMRNPTAPRQDGRNATIQRVPNLTLAPPGSISSGLPRKIMLLHAARRASPQTESHRERPRFYLDMRTNRKSSGPCESGPGAALNVQLTRLQGRSRLNRAGLRAGRVCKSPRRYVGHARSRGPAGPMRSQSSIGSRPSYQGPVRSAVARRMRRFERAFDARELPRNEQGQCQSDCFRPRCGRHRSEDRPPYWVVGTRRASKPP